MCLSVCLFEYGGQALYDLVASDNHDSKLI